MTERIAPLCKSVLGLDYSPKSVEVFNGKRILNAKAEVHDITDKSNSKKFDKIISCQVIQHIPTEELKVKALINIKSLLKENGTFVCELQDRTSLKRRFHRRKAAVNEGIPKEETEGFYIYRFAPKEFVDLLIKSEFKKIQIKREGGYFLTIAE